MRKDNYAYFVDTQGNRLDEGAKQLKEIKKLPHVENLSVGIPKVIKVNNRVYLVQLISRSV